MNSNQIKQFSVSYHQINNYTDNRLVEDIQVWLLFFLIKKCFYGNITRPSEVLTIDLFVENTNCRLVKGFLKRHFDRSQYS